MNDLYIRRLYNPLKKMLLLNHQPMKIKQNIVTPYANGPLCKSVCKTPFDWSNHLRFV